MAKQLYVFLGFGDYRQATDDEIIEAADELRLGNIELTKKVTEAINRGLRGESEPT